MNLLSSTDPRMVATASTILVLILAFPPAFVISRLWTKTVRVRVRTFALIASIVALMSLSVVIPAGVGAVTGSPYVDVVGVVLSVLLVVDVVAAVVTLIVFAFVEGRSRGLRRPRP